VFRPLLLAVLSILWGVGYGYLVIGRWRLDLMFGSGVLGAIVWPVVLQGAGVCVPIAIFIAMGFYPMRALEVLLSFVLVFLSAVASGRAYRRHSSRAARAAGLFGEEDL
jgi:hypothetical protein